jgi:hypothetical protein
MTTKTGIESAITAGIAQAFDDAAPWLIRAGTPDDADLERYRRLHKVHDERVGLAAAS